MPSILPSPEQVSAQGQPAFNLAVWQKVLADSSLSGLAYRIETDRYGQIVMSPPPSPEHGQEQAEIAAVLKKLLPRGFVITECPVSTREGVKAVDVAWISRARRSPQRGQVCLTHSPEICVEVISPSNTRRELCEKRTLFFEGGAEEVWFCQPDGQMEFYLSNAPEAKALSGLCPEFPQRISLD